MKDIIHLILLALGFNSITAYCSESNGPYLYEQLKNHIYKTTFNALLKNQKNIEPWLKKYLNSRDAVDTPREWRVINKKMYEFFKLCKPHDCPGNNLYVFFEPGGKHAWALFTRDDGVLRFFGNPDIEMQRAFKVECTLPQCDIKSESLNDFLKKPKSYEVVSFFNSMDEYYKIILKVSSPVDIKCVAYDNLQNPLAVSYFHISPPAEELTMMIQAPRSAVKRIQCLP